MKHIKNFHQFKINYKGRSHRVAKVVGGEYKTGPPRNFYEALLSNPKSKKVDPTLDFLQHYGLEKTIPTQPQDFQLVTSN